MNTLRISDLVFSVSRATLTADVRDDRLIWGINIEAEPEAVDGELWRPRVYSESLLPLEGGHVVYWRDAFEGTIVWEEGFDAAMRRPHASLFVFEHTTICHSRLNIITCVEAQMQIEWMAKCDVFFGSYQSGLELEIRTSAAFDGVIVGNRGEQLAGDQANQRLRRHIESGEYDFCEAAGAHEHPMMRPRQDKRMPERTVRK